MSVDCDVQDYIYSNLNVSQASKIYAIHNSTYNEVIWLYPSLGSKEVDSYVIYNYHEKHWNIGLLSRTCGVDNGPFPVPLMCAPTGYIYEHETGFLYDGAIPFAETGPFELGNGDKLLVGRSFYGDEKTQGDVNCTVYTRLYPNAPERSSGPYSFTTVPTPARFQGRQARFRFQAANSDDWRIGDMRVDVAAGSGR
jgi:hypothetical protein